MDGSRFDVISRRVGGALSRRSLGSIVTGLLAAGITASHADAELDRGRRQQPKKSNKPKPCLKTHTRCIAHSGGKGDHCRRCCTGFSLQRYGSGGRRCACKDEHAPCTLDKECCNRQCTGGECGACIPAETRCPAGCVNLLTSNTNCGTCGNACATEQGCCNGVCTDFTVPGTCGGCNVTCDAEEGCCDQTCAALDTNAHCGDCGTQCTGDDGCCDQACVNLQTSETHCGTCDNPCAGDDRCCGGSCVPLDTSEHCGACGIACASYQTCTAGTCENLPCGDGGPCRVFVTSATHDGDLGGIVGGDDMCNDLAEAVGMPRRFLAWLSDATSQPADRFYQSPQPYIRMDGAVVAASWTQLTTQDLSNKINLTESNETPTAEYVWAGTNRNGTRRVGTCGGWESNGAGPGDAGNWDRTNGFWSDVTRTHCGTEFALYCFEQPAP